MGRKPSEGFTEVEMEVMKILWLNGKASSDFIRLHMPGKEKRKDSTIRTILSIMEKKGYINHQVDGRTFIYRPLIHEAVAKKRAVSQLVENLFNGSPKMLLQTLIDSEKMDEKSTAEISQLLQKLKK